MNGSRIIRVLAGTTVALVLSACGSAASNNTGTMANMASASPAASTPAMASNMPGMKDTGQGNMANSTATSSMPFDAMFIDGMIPHHQGAVAMAREALAQAERPEVKQLAQDIIDAQEQEIGQLQAWRQEWYGDLAPTGGMSMNMSAMQMSDDASKPFDQRFLEAMIKHHQSAITMAQQAQTKAEHAQVRELATQIIADQQREIDQMEQWLQQWYGG